MTARSGSGRVAGVWPHTAFVPAGTIHAIGAGLVIVEIQQRSDATFRLFDHGRGRELHIEDAIAVADAGPASLHVTPCRLTDSRTLLTSNSHFTLKRSICADSTWCLEADRETWLLAVAAAPAPAVRNLDRRCRVCAADRLDIRAGVFGLSGLLAYAGGLDTELLQSADMETI